MQHTKEIKRSVQIKNLMFNINFGYIIYIFWCTEVSICVSNSGLNCTLHILEISSLLIHLLVIFKLQVIELLRPLVLITKFARQLICPKEGQLKFVRLTWVNKST
jgi:hypothetical protein